MSITLTGTGGIWTRLGKLFMAFRSCNQYSGDTDLTGTSSTPDALGTSFTDILAQFASADQDLMASLPSQRDDARGSLAAWKTYLQALAQAVVITQVDRDVTLAGDRKTLAGALEELIKQMVGAGGLPLETSDNDIDASTVTGTYAAAASSVGANTGNAVLLGSVKRVDGRQNQLLFDETMELYATTSEDNDGAGRAETWTGNGEPARDILDYRWPDGSGASFTLTTIDSAVDATDGNNLLTNSDWETFTVANTPDNWVITVGAAGTNVFKETSIIYGTHGAFALKITGDGGSTLTALTQAFDSASGTTATLKPNTVYHVNCFVKDSGAGLTAGVITFALIDGAGSITTDDAGTANSSTLAFGTTTASYAAKSFTFITPKVLPTTGLKFRIAVTTALTSGESMYIDDLAMAEAKEAYVGGPWLAIFAGSTDPIIGDKYTAVIANNYAGDFMLYTDRLFGMKEMRLQFPSDAAAGETIVDTLIS